MPKTFAATISIMYHLHQSSLCDSIKSKKTNGHFRLLFEIVYLISCDKKTYQQQTNIDATRHRMLVVAKAVFSKEVIPASFQDTIMSSEEHLDYHDVH